jgi:hypothetical protein
MAAPEATFFVFLFRLFPFHLFTTHVNRAQPLETIKGETQTHTSGDDEHPHLAMMDTHFAETTHTPPQKRPEIRSLSRKLVIPTTSTPMQDNTSNSRIHWT